MLFKQHWMFLGRKVSLILRVVRERTVLQYGMGNRCRDGQYVLFLDYDSSPQSWVEQEVRLLQERYRSQLGNAYVFKTKNGYHVVFLEKSVFGMITKMLQSTTCDKAYQDVPMYYARKVWVLRQSSKNAETIQYLGVLKAKANRERSRAHRSYLQKFYGIPTKDFTGGGEYDLHETLIMAYYRVTEAAN